jgi:hypothetical protein
MRYEAARDQIKTGDMLLWRDHAGGPLRGIVERWIVRHGTASPWTHVGVAWVDHGRVWVMEITTKGCAPRLLSGQVPFDWVAAPRELSERALAYAHSCFGEWTYSRWQAVMGALKRLVIGADHVGQCAEYALSVWQVDGMAPTDTATPGACVDGALLRWGGALVSVQGD